MNFQSFFLRKFAVKARFSKKKACTPMSGQCLAVGRTATVLSCNLVQPVPARVEEPVSPVGTLLVVVLRTIRHFPRWCPETSPLYNLSPNNFTPVQFRPRQIHPRIFRPHNNFTHGKVHLTGVLLSGAKSTGVNCWGRTCNGGEVVGDEVVRGRNRRG